MRGKLCLLSALIVLLACLCSLWLTKERWSKLQLQWPDTGNLIRPDSPSTIIHGSSNEERIIAAWDNFIKRPAEQFKRVSVGINSCLDLIVEAIPLLKALQIQPGSSHDHAVLQNYDQLQETFAYFFSKGSAAERTFRNDEVFTKMVATAQSQPNSQLYLGGNALLMANKISINFPKAKVQYVGPVGPQLRSIIPKSIDVPKESLLHDDEVHLILEYRVDDKWGNYVTPVATRFIINNNVENLNADILKLFFSSLETYQPDLIVFSGLHIFSTQDQKVHQKSIRDISVYLHSVPISVPVHLELASMTEHSFVKSILEDVVPLVSSLGLNEEELALLSHVANGPHTKDGPSLKLLGSSGTTHGFPTQGSNQPEIHKVSDIILWLLKNYGHSRESFVESRLTRIHFHSLTYHIVGVIPAAWKNSESAVAAGTQIAGRQACDTEQLSSDEVELKIPKTFRLHSNDKPRTLNEKRPVISWDMDGYHFVFSPVLVCRHPKRTVGLGDAISSTGLMYSQFSHKYRL